jgi:hypothetical protein
MIIVIARAMLVEQAAFRSVSLHRGAASVDRHREIIPSRPVRFAFPLINVNIAASHVCHPTIPLVNVHSRCSHKLYFTADFSQSNPMHSTRIGEPPRDGSR